MYVEYTDGSTNIVRGYYAIMVICRDRYLKLSPKFAHTWQTQIVSNISKAISMIY